MRRIVAGSLVLALLAVPLGAEEPGSRRPARKGRSLGSMLGGAVMGGVIGAFLGGMYVDAMCEVDSCDGELAGMLLFGGAGAGLGFLLVAVTAPGVDQALERGREAVRAAQEVGARVLLPGLRLAPVAGFDGPELAGQVGQQRLASFVPDGRTR